MWLKHFEFMKQFWEKYASIYEETHGVGLAPVVEGGGSCCVHVWMIRGESAMSSVRNGHDEMWKFLGPYGWSKGYMGPGGGPAQSGLIPSLEESIENKVWLVGSADEVAEQIQWYCDYLGGVENLGSIPRYAW
jgi:hypothetical protein